MNVSPPRIAWQPIEKAAFGLIYGTIVVLSLLMALENQPKSPFEPAAILFGSVLAVTLAKAFAELLSHAIETGERILTPLAWRAAWRHSHPILSVANLPTALFIAAGLGWLTVDTAALVSQGVCVVILLVLGARVGWVINHGLWLSIGGALFAGGIGLALAAMKYAIH